MVVNNDNNTEEDKNKINKEETEEKVDSTKQFPYDVKICDIWGSSTKDQVIIPVQRAIHGENVFLFNEKFGFKEPLPEDSDEFRQMKIEELNAEISKIEKLQSLNSNNVNAKDLKIKLKQYKNWLNSIQLQGRGSYMRFSQQGKPYFEFDRVGNFKMPVFKNVDKSLLYTPSESKIKLGSELIKENNLKNGDPNKGIKYFNILVSIFLIITLLGMLYFSYKVTALPDTCSVNLDKASAFFIQASNRIDNTASTLENITNRVYIKPEDVSPDIKTNVIN